MNTSKILNTMKTKKNGQKIEHTPLEKIINDEQQGRAKQANTKIEEYEKLISGLPDLLAGYGIQVKELCSEVGMARGSFYNRVRKLEFAPADLKKVYKYIENYPRTHKNTPETHEPPQNTQSPHPTQENATEAVKNDLPASLTSPANEDVPRPPVDMLKNWNASLAKLNKK